MMAETGNNRVQGWRPAATLLAVAVAYYVGAQLGFILRFPPTTPSVLWPPNSILTAALLLTPVRRWWLYLLAALPAHLAAELPVLPPLLVFGLFATNCAEALVAAAGLRWLSDAPTRFDTLPRMVVFVLVGALAAPFVSSFPDAALVTAIQGESYSFVWRTRFFSNVLASLTIVPAVVMAVRNGLPNLRAAAPHRHLEAGLLASGLFLASMGQFGNPSEFGLGLPAELSAPVAVLLPFLLWSAVRFGPGGLSVCLVATALLAVVAGTGESGIFVTQRAAEAVLSLQILLSTMAIPLMCLAAVIEERRQASEALATRLRLEEMLSRLSAAFVHLPSTEMHRALDEWLGRLGEHMGLDCVVIAEYSRTAADELVVRAWAPSEPVKPQTVACREVRWADDQLRQRQTIAVRDVGDLPPHAHAERLMFRLYGIRSCIVVPLEAGERVLGGLAVATTSADRALREPFSGWLRLVAEVFASALERTAMEDALRASEGMKSAILSSLSNGVAVLDSDGTIVAVSQSWTIEGATVGSNYVTAWRETARAGASHGSDAAAGIAAVLARERDSFAFEYTARDPTAERWYSMVVVPLNQPDGGAVISHTDVTERKRAEVNAQRSRQELAHFTRVSTMGALAASLAHELNQPLAAILSNAQAARRFLDAARPDLGEIRSILSDIVEDDKRAGKVIEGLRELLRKGETEVELLDLNALIRDVVKLLGSDALIRRVRMHLDVAAEPLIVAGDRIQLQQVVLNLLVNAMDAMADCPTEERVVSVQTELCDGQTARVSVQDAGPGILTGQHDLLFEPFYTTKPTGMGMGLSISRSIMEAHGGLIWATNNPARGATFSFAMPIRNGTAT